jgi:acetyltransferase-like isoleucine patch superfamily enzyme
VLMAIPKLERRTKLFITKSASYLPGNSFRCALYRLAGVEVGAKTYISRSAEIYPGVALGTGVTIGSEATIRTGAKIGKNVQIRRGVTIGANVEIHDNVTIGQNALIENAVIGKKSFVEYGVIFTGVSNNKIIIGRNCYIGIYAVLNWCGGIEISDFVHIAGPSVGLWTHSSNLDCLLGHELDDHSNRKVAGIKIENNVWIGGNSTIYPGVTIGHHSVILPNTAVNRSILPKTFAGGVPAKVIKKLEDGQIALQDVEK